MILLPKEDVPVTINFFPFRMDCTKSLSTFELSDQAVSSFEKKLVFFPSTSNIIEVLCLNLNPAKTETSYLTPPLVLRTKIPALDLFFLSNFPVVFFGSEKI